MSCPKGMAYSKLHVARTTSQRKGGRLAGPDNAKPPTVKIAKSKNQLRAKKKKLRQ